MTGQEAALIFSPQFHPNINEYTLIELPKEVLDHLPNNENENSGSLIIRGLETDNAVVCTKTMTYSISNVQSSNTMLFARPTGDHSQPTLNTGYEIQDSLSSYWELTPCQPRVDRLRTVLEDAPYRGPTEEARTQARRSRENEEVELHTTKSLQNIIQASDAELLQGLETLGALEIDGFWRLVDPGYQESILKFLLVSAVADDIPFDRLPLSHCVSMMAEADAPDYIVRHTLIRFSESPDVSGDRDPIFKLSEHKIGRFFGKQLLANAETRRTKLSTFLNRWREAVPEPFHIDLPMLQGLFLLEEEPNGSVIQYYPKDLLPMHEKPRFEALFQVRKRWAHEDIVPYISDLAPTTKQLDAILLKYARMFKVGQQTMYTSRFTYFKGR
ncbi:uncharacterized protein SPPG_08423 [Spizellomyces punctatus DAOM BR117]|uniref:Sister chromatid cohesion protein DCC1 n=1 Tax=Spizellomyces punctatus (strain DAOM BR117) TaxID=645134 RepID=A0A0L0H5S9_SPIPD|nr:uncharacterized protein SPPG_08423 [Spizellomyces punctatus DAOM BR117]KNC96271.1 hypothetical protein SPPG_08423 [Spizellomyces punctatus DAOM BR117]|eukprot:XP_016604311.1 hypothetical protein SPPG_08423 [Spizellomyces punctatus DAOM BR117]